MLTVMIIDCDSLALETGNTKSLFDHVVDLLKSFLPAKRVTQMQKQWREVNKLDLAALAGTFNILIGLQIPCQMSNISAWIKSLNNIPVNQVFEKFVKISVAFNTGTMFAIVNTIVP